MGTTQAREAPGGSDTALAGVVLVVAAVVVVVVAAAAALAAPAAAAAPDGGGDTVHVDDDWQTNESGDAVGDGYVLGTNASATLAGAVDLADPGDTVLVRAGDYDGVRVTKRLHVRAADGATPTVASDGAAVVQFEGSADGSTLDGFELVGDATLGVEVRGDDVAVTNNTISVATTGVQAQDDADGDGTVTGTLVADNAITGGVVGVSVNGGDTVTDNTVTGPTREGIGVAGTGNDVTGNDEVAPADGAPGVRFYGDRGSDELGRANDLLDGGGAVDAVAFAATGHVYDGSVAADGTVYATVQQAVDDVDPGAEVTLAPGTYEETVTVDQSVAIVGASETDRPVVDGGLKVTGDVADVTLADLELRGVAGADRTAYVADGSLADLTVENVAFRGGGDAGFALYGNTFAGNVTVEDSSVRGYADTAHWGTVYVATADGLDTVTFANNTVTDYAGKVEFHGDEARSGAPIDSLVVTDNEFAGAVADDAGAAEAALVVQDAADATVADNAFGADNFAHVHAVNADVTVAGLLDANDIPHAAGVVPADDDDGDDDGGPVTVYADVQPAVDAAGSGDTVRVTDGTYDVSAYTNGRLDVTTDGVTVAGESTEGVVFDGADSPWPVYASNQDDLALRNFTVAGTEQSGSDDGLKVAFADGLTVEDVTVEGSTGNELDLNNVRNATLRDVRALGEETGGVGVALTAVRNATLDGVETAGNGWGGVGLYDVADDVDAPADWTLQRNTANVTVTPSSDFAEPVPLYSDQEFGGELGDVYAPTYEYAVENPTHRDRGPDFRFFFEDREAAVEYALAVDTSENSTVQELTDAAELEGSDTYVVADGMSVQTAVDAAGDGGTVEVGEGTFRGRVTVTTDVTLSGAGRGETELFADSGDVRKNHEPTLSVYADATVEDLSVVRKVTSLADGDDDDDDGHTKAVGVSRESDGANTDAALADLTVELVDETGEDDYGNAVWVNSFNAVNGGERYQVNATLSNVTAVNDGVGVNTENGYGGAAVATAAVEAGVDLTVDGGTLDGEARGLHALQSGADLDVSVENATFADSPVHVLDGDGDALDLDAVLSSNDFDSAATVRGDDGDVRPASGAIHGTLQSAVESAPDDATVVGETGTFTEPVNVSGLENVTVTAASDDVVFRPASTVAVDRGGYGSDRVTTFRVVDSRNVTVSGFDVDFGEVAGENGVGTGSSPVYGVLFWNTSGTLADASVHDLNVSDGDGGYYEIAFHARAPDRPDDRLPVAVVDSEFRDVGRVGVNVHEYVALDAANNSFRSTVDDFGYAVELGSEATGAVRGNEISGFDTTAASDGSYSGGIYVENAFTSDVGAPVEKHVLVANNTVEDSQVGVQFGQTYDGLSSNTVVVADFRDNVVRNSSVAGVVVTDENADEGSFVRVFADDNTVADSRRGYWVRSGSGDASEGDADVVLEARNDTVAGNDVGALVEHPADDRTADYAVRFRYSSFVGNGEAVNESTALADVDARLNWFGDEDGPSEGAVVGDVPYEPFLTAPPSEVADDPRELQRFGFDLAVPGDGEARAVGFPAAINETFGEVFGDFDGVVYAYDAEAESWTVPDADAAVGALDAAVVVADDATEYSVSFANAEPAEAPGERELEPGWNFVAAPQHGGVEHSFDAVAGAEVDRVVRAFDGPDGVPEDFDDEDFGAYTLRDSGAAELFGGPVASPFSGYWVYVSSEGSLGGAAYPGLTLEESMQTLTTYEREPEPPFVRPPRQYPYPEPPLVLGGE